MCVRYSLGLRLRFEVEVEVERCMSGKGKLGRL
jgi:hypothetical protein